MSHYLIFYFITIIIITLIAAIWSRRKYIFEMPHRTLTVTPQGYNPFKKRVLEKQDIESVNFIPSSSPGLRPGFISITLQDGEIVKTSMTEKNFTAEELTSVVRELNIWLTNKAIE